MKAEQRMSASATHYDAYYKAMGGQGEGGQLVDAYEGMIESQRRRMTDDFDDSPQGDSMMSPPLEPIESFEPKASQEIEMSEAST